MSVPLVAYLAWEPQVGPGVVLEEQAFVIGRARVAGPALVRARAVIRSDDSHTAFGPRFVIGEGSTVHVDGGRPTVVGSDVVLGADVVLHGCTLGDCVRIEDGGLVLNGGSVGSGSLVAADSLVSEGASFPENSYIAGTPGRRLRDTTPEERAETRRIAAAATGA
jgi:carbonic anhydrase/acetyltransferase-like protein (isoleucine patch superfamily)